MLTIEDALKTASSEDWSFMDELEKRFGITPQARTARKRDEDRRKALASAAAKIFATKEGEMVLEWMLDQTFRRFTFAVMQHPDPGQAAFYGAFREGQNAMVLTVLQMIAQGRGDPLPAQKD